ncbi:hypothetical protein NP493_87g03055 [Ridgeia piscesae]|uniref:Uncharacterized protein n=1 Tax=Ridgeia piscesae TaxID=27915 RepID=A0AAD9UI44_RIDPI|nr:hypothetical protein NP493_87g03055 [Ridgeia piscesae]
MCISIERTSTDLIQLSTNMAVTLPLLLLSNRNRYHIFYCENMLLLAELRFVISRCQKQQEIAASTMTWDAVTTVTKDKFSQDSGVRINIFMDLHKVPVVDIFLFECN